MNIDTIFSNLDKWIDQNTDNPIYRYHKFEDKITTEVNKPINTDAGIKHIVQQEKTEITEFVQVLLQLPQRKIALEVGLGKFGGTHMLWREIFDNVVTIEFNGYRIRDFKNRNNLDNRSKLICGDSNDRNIKKLLPKLEIACDYEYDFLFLDGNHEYEAVKKDYMNLSDFVKKGGIIAFHDILSDYYGVKQFLIDLSQGKIDGIKHKIHRIEHSEVMGIGYLYV